MPLVGDHSATIRLAKGIAQDPAPKMRNGKRGPERPQAAPELDGRLERRRPFKRAFAGRREYP